MPQFIITWDAGYGDTSVEIEAAGIDEAEMEAYEAWKEDAESNAIYSAQEYSDELADELL